MPMPKTVDPLKKYREGVRANIEGRERPVPLASTRIAVEINGGVASVTTVRTFSNAEDQDIEPTMSFPVPVDAALCLLKAKIGDRELVAVAEPKSKARESYESAIDRGKSAVLHEELIKGVHMLSVGRVPPRAEVVVTSIFILPLAFVGERPGLRIPTTVGEIFGRTPLIDSDDLVVSDHEHCASLTIACDNGTATLLGGALAKGGEFDVALDAPIDIVVTGWKPKELKGIASDGREVRVKIEPLGKVDAALDADVVIDRSGSMNERAEGGVETRHSKFELATGGLRVYADKHVGVRDRLRVWEFNASVNFLGETVGSAVSSLLGTLQPPSGSTELVVALDAVVAREGARNVVLLTDGKTWALDPQRYARAGIRVTAVLIGEDALEGGVSHLAGLTGGLVFIPLGSDVPAAVAAALDAARAPFEAAPAINGRPEKLAVVRRGARIEIEWKGNARKSKASEADRRVGALAAYLALPSMEADAAAALAAEEGIVCHLTSLVLVDEAVEERKEIPATRKVALTRPRTAMLHSAPVAGASLASVGRLAASIAPLRSTTWSVGHGSTFDSGLFESQSFGGLSDLRVDALPMPTDSPALDRAFVVAALASAARSLNWNASPGELLAGDLSSLPAETAEAIRKAAALPDIAAAAKRAGVDPVVFVIALLARAASERNRTAGRVMRAVLGSSAGAEVASAAGRIGL